ncbi:hypothetical protein B4102_0175 [Heyndrickxia sporothermodurans]|uniref:Uncharacterized protein n=1 Tax=Heyndrickxia sporothermodurans TaxID=46224 RepID=A0A150LGY3_9BACI|nr:hypothetical protein B4102_0175 [Heyndrickxia sporothermodurans]
MNENYKFLFSGQFFKGVDRMTNKKYVSVKDSKGRTAN